MAAAIQLLAFGLRQVIDVTPDVVEDLAGMAADVAASAGTAGKVIAFVRQRLTDHGETLPKALVAANDRAWQAVAVALAGRGFFNSVKEFFTGRTPKALHEQVEAFLTQNPDGFPGTSHEFRQACLRELHQAEKAGLLAAGRPDPDGWARQAATYWGLADPQARIAEAHQAAAAVADALPRDYPNLARLLKGAAPPGQAPLLVAAFSFFFRRQVETNDQLHRGLTFEGLRQLSVRQEAAFEALGQALADLNALLDNQGRRFADVLDHLGQIEDKLDTISAQIAELAGRNHVPTGPPRPQYVITINNEREQALARRLLAEVRKLPPERQDADDLSLLGDVLRAAGLYQEATESYAGAAAQAEDRAARAANHYKMYLNALEQRRWDEGLAALTTAAELDAPHYAPFPLRQYEPRRILGAGGFGTAFLCRHRYLNREVVIKSLYHADLEQGLDKVFAEAQTLLLLSREHPSIIGVQDCNFADDAQARPYIVMDYFPGVSLQAHLEQLGPKAGLPLEDFLPIARQIAEAMQAAHGRGVLHRDLKPDNVLVLKKDGRWQVKVIDFGLAVRTRTVQASTSRPAQERTLYGDSVAGTAKYASPEQMGEMPGIKVDTYSDVYTFGKLCCYALFRDTEPMRRQWASLPGELADMLERCVEKDLEHRHRTFEPVLAVLKALDSVEDDRRRQEEEARRQAEAERLRQEQARQKEAQRRQEHEKRRQAEQQRREREEAERRRQEQELRQEGETKLAVLVRQALERNRGEFTTADKQAAIELCRQHQVVQERADAIGREVREKWQKEQPRPGEVVTNSLGVKFAWVPPGTFLMGSPESEKGRYDDEAQHRITLTKGFRLGVHQVTRGQFARFVKAAGYKTEAERDGGAHYWTGKEWKLDANKNWRTPGFDQADDHPVVCISWNDAVAFCDWLTRQDSHGRRYRLPWEAEWEYACRAGTTRAYPWGDRIEDGKGWCNIADQSFNTQFPGFTVAPWDDGYVYTSPVGAFRPNAWGLYDLVGNVWEWCADWFGPYPKGDVIDQKISESGESRVLRGGCWDTNPGNCRAACRFRYSPSLRFDRCGFRVVLCLD